MATPHAPKPSPAKQPFPGEKLSNGAHKPDDKNADKKNEKKEEKKPESEKPE
jgi:hypothetical protein